MRWDVDADYGFFSYALGQYMHFQVGITKSYFLLPLHGKIDMGMRFAYYFCIFNLQIELCFCRQKRDVMHKACIVL